MKNIAKHLKVILVLFSAVFVFILIENNTVNISRYVSKSSKIDPNSSALIIAQISDFHNCTLGAQIVKKLEIESPDIICITGDLIDVNHTDIACAVDLVKELKDIAPVYFVSGNHEAWMIDYNNFVDQLVSLGVIVLDDTVITLPNTENNSTITLSGVKDPAMVYIPDNDVDSTGIINYQLEEITIDTSNYNILLSHRPEAMQVYANHEYDLVLSGHAHGGQFIIPYIGGLIAPDQGFFPQYYGGKYRINHTEMIVSRGLGNSIIPVRINNTPEVVIVTISSES